MKYLRSIAARVVIAACFTMGGAAVGSGADARFDVNDVAYLWPAPSSPADVNGLISGAEPVAGSALRLWPADAFELLLQTAQTTTVTSSAGRPVSIDFAQFASEFKQPETWKVVGFRVDPSAPGSHPSVIAQFGSTPQIRLILQPVTVKDGVVRVHDVTAHLAYSFITGLDPQTRLPIANRQEFARIIADLTALKGQADRAGATTAGSLRVHPGLARRVPEFATNVRNFLTRHLAQAQLTEMAFMGTDPPEPWVFFAMARRPDGLFVPIGPPSLGGQRAQMLTFRGGTPVMPAPRTTNIDAASGVSTAPLFRSNAAALLPTAALATAAHPLHSEVPDFIANPRLTTVRNTDCVSCHTESTRRLLLHLGPATDAIVFQREPNVSGVDPGHLPQDPWNLRNFGWFQSRDGVIHPTVTTRAGNEVADAVAFVNAEYLRQTADARTAQPQTTARRIELATPENVANPLTLIMNIKSPQDFAQLKGLLDKIQGMPPEQNPVWRALTKIGTVHFARFVFLGESQLAVITTYDGSFEDYIDAFVNTIGPVFDQLLSHMADAPPLPVSDHRKEFLAYVQKNDLKAIAPFYSAYPTLKVQDILTLQNEAKQF
jgi:hypothetical protein